jgi:hypothetical protein
MIGLLVKRIARHLMVDRKLASGLMCPERIVLA